MASYAYGIDDAGTIVGVAIGQAVRYLPPDYYYMATLGLGYPSTAYAVKFGLYGNTFIAGQQYAASENNAFLWKDGVVTNLGNLGTYTGGTWFSVAYGLTDFGWTVGQTSSTLGNQAFIYYNNGTPIQGLGDLPGEPFNSAAFGINKSRVVVGYGTTTFGTTSVKEAMLWDEKNGMVSLNTLLSPAKPELRLAEARAINDRCEIVGYAFNSTYGAEAFLLTPITPTTIALSKNSLSFTANEGVTSQPYQEVKVQNSGVGTFVWYASTTDPWIISTFPSWGTNPCGHVRYSNIAVSNAGLAAGIYNGSVTIAAEGAVNTPVTLPVTFTVNPYPKIGFSASSFSFTSAQPGPSPAPQTLSIWNSQHDTLNWTVSKSASWLSLTPASGSSTGVADVTAVELSVNAAGLAPGNYTTNITIASTRAVNTTETVAVTLTVTEAAPVLAVSPADLLFSGVQGLANPPAQTLHISNTSGGMMTWSVSVDPGASIFSVTPASGLNTVDVTVAVNTAGLLPGTHTGRLSVTAPGASGSPQYVDLSLIVSGQVEVIAPDDGQQIKSGSAFPITWQTNGTVRPVTKTALSYSTNGGSTWKAIKTLAGNPGTYTWSVPKSYSTACKVQVVLKDSSGVTLATDVSDTTFTIYR